MFKGTYTAIVTPFNGDNSIDFGKLRELIDIQAESGVDGIVPAGTTGESPALNYDEHSRLIDESVKAANGRIKVIAGTGANSTSEALDLTRHAIDSGADASLQVTPYYNKPNQEGLFRHFSAVAELGIPIVLYNVPGRSGREIEVNTIARLSANPNIVAVKEAAGSCDRVSAILSRCDLTVLSGDDSLTLPMMVLGASGVISVASNVIPGPVSEMVNLALDKKWDDARNAHMKLYRLFSDLFIDTNPIPVKAAMAMVGLIEEHYRLPICPMADELKAELRKTLEATGLL